jgi:4-hydroxythreonine-4-phosphate dehydrogenase
VTPGCPAGIGPEVVARALADIGDRRDVAMYFYASKAQLLEGARRARVKPKALEHVVCLYEVGDDRGAVAKPGLVDDDALASQRDALVRACEGAVKGEIDAIVTGPVRKKALVVDGVSYPGQTEIVAHHLGGAEPPLMVFAGAPFVLGLATVHVALAEVPKLVDAALLDRALRQLEDAARAIVGKKRPTIVALGLNPHAGEGGMFGREDDVVIRPALARAFDRGARVVLGPRPADGFFADVARGMKGVDAVLAMFHDQGLAPYKLLVGGEGVNVTWGAKVPRTSPDHGTADALAGSGRASSSSMRAAIELAVKLARKSR